MGRYKWFGKDGMQPPLLFVCSLDTGGTGEESYVYPDDSAESVVFQPR